MSRIGPPLRQSPCDAEIRSVIFAHRPFGLNRIWQAVSARANTNRGDILISEIVLPQRGRGAVGVPNVLADPTLEFRDSNGVLLRANDNWRDDPAQEALIIASGIPPTNDLESAIVVSGLSPGSYTALAFGRSSGTGIGYAQFYTLPHSGPELELICPFCGQ